MITDDIYRKPNGLWKISALKGPFKSALILARAEVAGDVGGIFRVYLTKYALGLRR
jgi:hypothetical protein